MEMYETKSKMDEHFLVFGFAFNKRLGLKFCPLRGVNYFLRSLALSKTIFLKQKEA